MPGSERRTHGKGRVQDGGVGERGSAGPRGGWTGQEAGPGGWAWGGSPGPGRASSGAGQRRPSQARDGAVARAAARSQPTLWTRMGRGTAAPRAPSPTGASQPPSRPLRTPAWNNPKSIIDRNRIVANLSLKPIMELHSSPFLPPRPQILPLIQLFYPQKREMPKSPASENNIWYVHITTSLGECPSFI